MTPSSQGQTRTITAFFDNRTDAEEAVQRLHSAGISRDAVRMMAGYQGRPERDVNPDSYRGASENNEGIGFWEALKDLFLPEEDRHTYAEGLRRGGYLVTVQTRDADYARALDILDDEGTIDSMSAPRLGARRDGPATAGRTIAPEQLLHRLAVRVRQIRMLESGPLQRRAARVRPKPVVLSVRVRAANEKRLSRLRRRSSGSASGKLAADACVFAAT
jgi:hypothetical protein